MMLRRLVLAAAAAARAAQVYDVQLAGCNTDCGRVEVRFAAGGPWHGVAAANWTLREAAPLCRHLGFAAAGIALNAGWFAQLTRIARRELSSRR